MSAEDYRASLRSATRGFWSGALDADQFDSHMRAAMNRELAIAWAEGAAECGVESEEDYSPEDWLVLGNAIQAEIEQVPSLALDIEAGRKGEGLLTPLLDRMETWTLRYQDIRNEAKLRTCKDEKLEWVYGDTVHCDTCLALNGVVKRASYWQQSGVQPQSPPNPAIDCGGWRCLCTLELTDKPITRGTLPVRRGAFLRVG